MSFLGQTEESQVEQIAAGLDVLPGDVVRRLIEAAFSRQEEKRLFLDMLALYRDMGSEKAANLFLAIDMAESTEQDTEEISFAETLRNYIIDGVVPIRSWRKFQEFRPYDFSASPTLFPPTQNVGESPFYETAVPKQGNISSSTIIPLSRKKQDLIAKLEQWNREDATVDPQEIARREAH